MLNITDLHKEQQITPLLRLGFRPFFLLGGLFAFAAIAIWILVLNGAVNISPLNGMFWWHSHEMLFGFVPAIIAGFLLTAVQTWTNVPSVKSTKLLVLVVLWLSARILLLVNFGLPFWAAMAVDLAFLPLVGIFLAIPLIKVGQQRNMIFLPLLFLMAVANAFTYLPQLGLAESYNTQGLHGMVMLVTLLVALLGGRVIPMFTANGTQTPKVLPIKWLEITSLLSLFIIFVGLIAGLSTYSMLLGLMCAISALLHLYRILRWRPWVTLKVPLVWSLHFAMLFIPIGLFMMSLHFLLDIISFSAALHSLTVGVIGGMILAMMSRVSLGHTGRPLTSSPLITFAFVSVLAAALLRSVFVAVFPANVIQLWLVSGIFWCVAFALFVWVYLPILSTARLDGRPG
ncbi:MAG: hypothetical protein CL600_12810 [Alteromonas sp.]|nr:hypothetical protein [Alteromonas sp.]